MDTFKLTGATLRSVQQEGDEDEEMIFAELYKELVAADTRVTRRQGSTQGVRVGRGKGLVIRGVSTSTGRGMQTYTRRGSSSSNPTPSDTTPLPREPSFDDEGNLISETESEHEDAPQPPLSDVEESSSDSLDEHSDSDVADDSSDSSSSYDIDS